MKSGNTNWISFDGSAKYEIDVSPNRIFLNAISRRDLGTMNAMVDADGNGKLPGWRYAGRLAE